MRIVKTFAIAPDAQGNPREWDFSLNHSGQAILDLEDVSRRPGWAVICSGEETATRLYQLAWAASSTFRAKNGITISWDEFRSGQYLPEYLSDEWLQFQDQINNLVAVTFPKAAETRIGMQTLTAAMTLSQLCNTAELIGTSASTGQSESSE